jgi:DNA (cytosine-5)-methyltransferase 1
MTSKDTVYQWRRVYVRENKSNVCPTLTANMGTGGHNVPLIKDNFGIRKLTPRECFSFQGYPHNYILPNLANGNLYKQAGNSVTTTLVERIANEIIKVL